MVRLDALGAVGIVGTNNPVGGAANDTAPNADSGTDDLSTSAGDGMSVGSRYLVGTNNPIIRVRARAPTQGSMGNGTYNLPTYQQTEDGQELFGDWVARELGRPTGTEES